MPYGGSFSDCFKRSIILYVLATDMDGIPVEEVEITRGGTAIEEIFFYKSSMDGSFIPAEFELTAQVTPPAAFDKTVEWAVTGDFEINNGVLSPKSSAGDGSTGIVTATTNGIDEDGEEIEATVNVKVVLQKMVVLNQKEVPDGSSTPSGSLPALDNGRIVLINENTGSSVGNSSSTETFANNVIAYFNAPFTYHEDGGVFVPYGIEARIRLTDLPASGRNSTGVIMGVFTDPNYDTEILSWDEGGGIYFAGVLAPQNAQRRLQATRVNVIGSPPNVSTASFGAYKGPDPEIYGNYNIDGTTAGATDAARLDFAADQEYIYKFYRTKETEWTGSIWSSDGQKMLFEQIRERRPTTPFEQIHEKLIDKTTEHYLGFIHNNSTVEISDIVIKDGSTVMYEAAKGAAPMDVPVDRLEIGIIENDAFKASGSLVVPIDDVDEGHTLIARLIPLSAKQDIDWTIVNDTVDNPDAMLSSATGQTVTVSFDTWGKATVTASSYSDSTKKADFAYNILEELIPINTITISGVSEVIKGHGGELTATVNGNATFPDLIQWSITEGSDIISVSQTGWVKGLKVGTGKVRVATKDVEGSTVVSNELSVEVKNNAGKTIVYNFGNNAANYPYNTIGSKVVGNTAANDVEVGDLQVLRNFSAYAANSQSIDGFNGTDYLRTNGVSWSSTTALIINQRAFIFEAAGPCTITVYARTTTADRSVGITTGTTQEIAQQKRFDRDEDDEPTTLNNINFRKWKFDFASPTVLRIFSSASIDFYGFKIEYDAE